MKFCSRCRRPGRWSSPPTRGAWIEIEGAHGVHLQGQGRPPHGGRGLKWYNGDEVIIWDTRRPPHGGRGLKSRARCLGGMGCPSPPTRGAWIEIIFFSSAPARSGRRPPHGGRGLKSRSKKQGVRSTGRPPHGGRGLKFQYLPVPLIQLGSPPTRGAWIEMGGAGPAVGFR